jgi:hypothetical protein
MTECNETAAAAAFFTGRSFHQEIAMRKTDIGRACRRIADGRRFRGFGCGMQQPSSTVSRPASNTLSLTIRNRRRRGTLWHGQATEQKAPSSFNAIVGAVVPAR